MKYWIALLTVLCTFLIGCKKKNLSKSIPAANPLAICDTFYFNLIDGTMNGVAPSLPDAEIREWLPCYSSFTPYGSDSNCFGAVFYKKYDFYYYTVRDFIEVRTNYKGHVNPPVMGKSREDVIALLGSKPVTNIAIDSVTTNLFVSKYGCVQVDYTNNKVSSVSAHYNECEILDTCR